MFVLIHWRSHWKRTGCGLEQRLAGHGGGGCGCLLVVGAASSLVAIFVGLQWLEKSSRVIEYVQLVETVEVFLSMVKCVGFCWCLQKELFGIVHASR